MPRLADLGAEESLQSAAAQAMRCGGCGAKVGAGVLAQALGTLRPLPNSDVLIGLSAPDDAALVRVPPGKAVVQTVDFFRALSTTPIALGKLQQTTRWETFLPWAHKPTLPPRLRPCHRG
jgi:selenide,water dikinase